MKDQYGIRLLKKYFHGENSKNEFEYKQLIRRSNKCIYEVKDTWGYFFEVILIRTFTSPFTQRTEEIYPDESLLGKCLWRFDDYEDALQFYKKFFL